MVQFLVQLGHSLIALVVFWPVITNLLTVTAVLGAISNLVLGTVEVADVGVLHCIGCGAVLSESPVWSRSGC